MAIRGGVAIKIIEDSHIEEYVSKPAHIILQEVDVAILTIHEGKKRQIRRMFDALGNYVLSIHRLAISDMKLEDYEIKKGNFREVSKEEILEKCF
jgi:16S rRNA U516 pseudouridylate synthase RsuA-like enzyme